MGEIVARNMWSKAIAENKNAIVASCWTYFTTIQRCGLQALSSALLCHKYSASSCALQDPSTLFIDTCWTFLLLWNIFTFYKLARKEAHL